MKEIEFKNSVCIRFTFMDGTVRDYHLELKKDLDLNNFSQLIGLNVFAFFDVKKQTFVGIKMENVLTLEVIDFA